MAKKKFCPICDQPITGRFCKTCMEFVTPYEHEVSYHMNSEHDPKNDAGCDYHEKGFISKEQKARIDRLRMEQAKRSYETHGASNINSDVSNDKAKKVVKIIFTVFFIIFIINMLFTILSGFLFSDIFDDFDWEDFDESIDVDIDDDMEYPFYPDDYLSEEEYQKLLLEKGFDKNGYKEADLNDILKENEGCNAFSHFDLKSRTAQRHLLSALKDSGLSATDMGEENESDNYFFMDRYGNITSYYMKYSYISLASDDAADLTGHIILTSDTVTDELMVVYIYESDPYTLYSACLAIIGELDTELDTDTVSLKEDISNLFEDTSSEEVFDVFHYGDLSVFVEHSQDDSDTLPYYAEITLD